jgi:hypothetical protein
MAFHSRDGLFFERNDEDASVRVYFKPPLNLFPVAEVTLDASTWASVVASMSDAGESWETWANALEAQVGVEMERGSDCPVPECEHQ